MEKVSGYSIEDEIVNFYGIKNLTACGLSCPLCGASLDWNWSDATNLKLHIDWHKRIGFWEIDS